MRKDARIWVSTSFVLAMVIALNILSELEYRQLALNTEPKPHMHIAKSLAFHIFFDQLANTAAER